jgi:hypothetical protein
MPPKAIFMLIGTALLLIAGYFFSLYVIHGFSPDFLAINRCVESGGRWDYKKRQCEQLYDPRVLQDQAPPESNP